MDRKAEQRAYMANFSGKMREMMAQVGMQREELETEKALVVEPGNRNKPRKKSVVNSQEDATSRICHQLIETRRHIVNGSPSLAELEYKRKYDNIVRPVHWDFAGKRGFRRGEEWCKYVPESVVENENLKLPRDYGKKTDHEVRSRRPESTPITLNTRQFIGTFSDCGGQNT